MGKCKICEYYHQSYQKEPCSSCIASPMPVCKFQLSSEFRKRGLPAEVYEGYHCTDDGSFHTDSPCGCCIGGFYVPERQAEAFRRGLMR